MSTEKKVELITSVKDEYGLAPALRALELPRATWYYNEKHRVCPTYETGVRGGG
jgi:hypothetical protein